MRTIIRLQKKCGINGQPLELHITKMHQQYKECIYSYRKFRKNAVTSRSAFQDKRIKKLALAGNTKTSSIRLEIKNVEASRAQNRRIRSVLRTKTFAGVTQVDMINPLTN